MKWPKSEEKTKFGKRWVLGPDSVPGSEKWPISPFSRTWKFCSVNVLTVNNAIFSLYKPLHSTDTLKFSMYNTHQHFADCLCISAVLPGAICL